MMVRALLLASAAVALAAAIPAAAAPDPSIRESVALCNPNSPQRCVLPNADGSINVVGGGGGGGGATGTITTPSSSGQAAASGQNVNSQNLVYDSTNSLWRNWIADPSGRGYVDPIGSAGTVFTQGTAAANANSLNASTTPATGSLQQVSGSAATALNQGTGAANANSANVYIGGSVAQQTTGVVATNVAGTENPLRTGCDTNSTTTTTAAQGRVALQCSPQGALLPPITLTTAGFVITKTSVAVTTSTTVCPAMSAAVAANAISEELQVSAAGGLGLVGEALTSATQSAAAGSPDLAFTAAATYTYTAPTALAQTFYAPAATFVTCIQRFAK